MNPNAANNATFDQIINASQVDYLNRVQQYKAQVEAKHAALTMDEETRKQLEQLKEYYDKVQTQILGVPATSTGSAGNYNGMFGQGGAGGQGIITGIITKITPGTSGGTGQTGILVKDVNGNLVWQNTTGGTFIAAVDPIDSEFDEYGREKAPVEFESLPEEVKQKAKEKLSAFDDIVKPSLKEDNRKQGDHIQSTDPTLLEWARKSIRTFSARSKSTPKFKGG
jgi:hypothetical protein